MPVGSPFRFELLHVDARLGARRGRLHTPRGAVETPAFMPVGTQGAIKGLDIQRVAETGAQMVLANTYHLALRPGDEVVADLGGLHAMMGWNGPILTDSGGFQVFSLADRAVVSASPAPAGPLDARLILRHFVHRRTSAERPSRPLRP